MQEVAAKLGERCGVASAWPQEPGPEAERAAWGALAKVGLIAVAAPVEYGGSGGSALDHAVVVEQLGFGLVPGPLYGAAYLAVPALSRAGTQLAAELSASLASGDRVVVLADAGGSRQVTADERGRLSGSVAQFVDAQHADILLVSAETPNGMAVYATSGGERAPLTTMDLTRGQSRVVFDAVEAELVCGPETAPAVLAAARLYACVMLAAESVGLAGHLLAQSVEHAKVRRQFGQPIGAFQAVKHRLADMLVHVELARSCAYAAAWALSSDDDQAEALASQAKALCTDSAYEVGAGALQLHGGSGFTWENPAHLYYKRAVANRLFLGSPSQHRDLLVGAVIESRARTGDLSVAGLTEVPR